MDSLDIFNLYFTQKGRTFLFLCKWTKPELNYSCNGVDINRQAWLPLVYEKDPGGNI